MPVFLKILAAPKKEDVGTKIPVIEGDSLIGRVSPPCDIILEGTKVSKKHCAIRSAKGQLLIEDLNSSNGLYVNGGKVSSAQLKSRDKIVIGEFVLELVVS